MANGIVQFPIKLSPGMTLKVPCRPGSAEELLIHIVRPIRFNSVGELYDYCQDEEGDCIKLSTKRKAS